MTGWRDLSDACLTCLASLFFSGQDRYTGLQACSCRFSYQLLQGYDFVHLCRSSGVQLQVSLLGSSQIHALLHSIHTCT